MSIPSWARWALAAILVAGIATAGVAANLAVLGSGDDDTRLGTLSARSLQPDATPIPRPRADDAPATTRDDEGGGHDDEDEGEEHGDDD